MRMDSEQVLDSIFLSYNNILKRLHSLGRTTKNEKEFCEDLEKLKIELGSNVGKLLDTIIED